MEIIFTFRTLQLLHLDLVKSTIEGYLMRTLCHCWRRNW